MKNFFRVDRARADSWMLFDNSGAALEMVAFEKRAEDILTSLAKIQASVGSFSTVGFCWTERPAVNSRTELRGYDSWCELIYSLHGTAHQHDHSRRFRFGAGGLFL